MAIQYMSAFLAAFLIVLVSGKMFIPWLERHNASQPLKKEVENGIYRIKMMDHRHDAASGGNYL